MFLCKIAVAACVAVWIEITDPVSASTLFVVAACVAVWIEIMTSDT